MPHFDNNWRRVFELVSQSTGAQQPEAAKATDAIVQDLEAVNLLAIFCVASKFGMGAGGVGNQLGIAQVGQPAHIVAGLGVKHYCESMISHPNRAIDNRIKHLGN